MQCRALVKVVVNMGVVSRDAKLIDGAVRAWSHHRPEAR